MDTEHASEVPIESQTAEQEARGSDTSAADIVRQLFENLDEPEAMSRYFADHIAYEWSNYAAPELKRIMPWVGAGDGIDSFMDRVRTFRRYREVQRIDIDESFCEGDRVAVFGTFTYRSRTLGKAATSLFVLLIEFADSTITYFQFLEDTFSAALTCKVGGSWTMRANPDGGEVEI